MLGNSADALTAGPSRRGYGAVVAGTREPTVHREPISNLRNLPVGISIPLDEEGESDVSQGTSTEYTDTTQGMVSTLTSLGSRELARYSYWSQPNGNQRNSEVSSGADTNQRPTLPGLSQQRSVSQGNFLQTRATAQNGHAVFAGMDNRALNPAIEEEPLVRSAPILHRHNTGDQQLAAAVGTGAGAGAGEDGPVSVAHTMSAGQLTRALPPLPTTVTTTSRVSLAVPEPSPQRAISPPLLQHQPQTDTNANQLAPYVARAVRYADFNDQHRYAQMWASHDFGLTDSSFRPPRPYTSHSHTHTTQTTAQAQGGRSQGGGGGGGRNRGVQVYQYGGYQDMDIFY